MPSLIGSGIDANYRQQIVPFSRFGTRKVAWYAIRHADTRNGALDMEKLNTIVDTIQTRMEVVMVGAPYISDNWGKFMVAVFEDTANDGNNSNQVSTGYNANATTLQDALQAATGESVMVERFYLFGAPATDTDQYYGFSNSNTYQEYDTKAQFINNSYTQNNC
jgi:hypothetical protein